MYYIKYGIQKFILLILIVCMIYAFLKAPIAIFLYGLIGNAYQYPLTSGANPLGYIKAVSGAILAIIALVTVIYFLLFVYPKVWNEVMPVNKKQSK